MKIFICVIVTVIFSRVNSWKCPTHCFCYSWRNMKRTDCVGKNLYNTFVGFSQETQVLDLTRNAISILHGNEFLDTNLKLLKHLILSENRLHSIDKLSFNGLEYLEYLDLSYNGIEYISPVTFQFNPNLNTLNVSNNPLTVKKDEPFLTVAPSLQVLNMAQSDLKFLTFQMFTDLKKLRVLDLSNNKIQKVDVEALETITDLKFLDISKNNIPCDDESFKVYHWLLERRIPFQPFCKNQKLMTEISEEKIPHLEGPTSRISSDSKITNIIYSEKNGMNENIKRFFKSIPSIHAMILGVQIGMLIGAFLTYFCMRKTSRLPPLFKSRRNRNTERSRLSEMSYRFDNNDMTSSLVPLNTPPGTPPSPYHSRLTLPSDFSLTKTERV